MHKSLADGTKLPGFGGAFWPLCISVSRMVNGYDTNACPYRVVTKIKCYVCKI